MISLFTWGHIYPTDGYVPLQWQEFHDLLFVIHILQLILLMNYTCFQFINVCIAMLTIAASLLSCAVLFSFIDFLFLIVALT